MLVKIEGKKGEERLVVSSRQVAEDFERRHNDVMDSIRKILVTKKIVSKHFYEHEFVYRGQAFSEYLMDEQGFSLVVMGFTGEKALDWKIKYIEAFSAMRNELRRIYAERKQWEIERAKGILTRHILTETIKNLVPDSPHKNFMYTNYTKLIYMVLFNKTMKELREMYGVKGQESVRDHLTEDQLADVENLEHLISGLLNIGWGYERIKSFLMENAVKEISA